MINGKTEVGVWLTANRAHVSARLAAELTLTDVIDATMHYVNQARKVNNLADTTTMTVTLPYDPPMRELFEAAEPILAQAFVALDWSRWQVWTLERHTVGDDWTPDPFVLLARGEYRCGVSWIGLGLENATVNRVEPELARRAAARLLAVAEAAERAQAEALEAKR
jgi:hypothetical protein